MPRRLAVAAALLAVACAGGCTKTVVGEPVAAPDPEPITRAQMLKRYAEINPIDQSATPRTVDWTTRQVCTALDQGISTDELITTVAKSAGVGPHSTEVARLIVAYGCPEYLDRFK